MQGNKRRRITIGGNSNKNTPSVTPSTSALRLSELPQAGDVESGKPGPSAAGTLMQADTPQPSNVGEQLHMHAVAWCMVLHVAAGIVHGAWVAWVTWSLAIQPRLVDSSVGEQLCLHG